ncbi:MAG: glycosyltransferase family 39 protein [Candidatus Omnitrophota bacterium]
MKIRKTHFILFALLQFCLVVRLPALWIPHIENDEVIYQTLADKVSKNPADYTLRGTPILKNLPEKNYDQPLFHRPPLFVYFLALFRSLIGKNAGVLLSILAGVFTVAALFGIAKELYGERLAWICAVIISFCPLLLFCSTRILIDAPLAFLVTLTVGILVVALKRKSRLLFSLSGLALGLAVLTKEPGALAVFPCAYLLFKDGINKEKGMYLLYFLGCAFIIVLPWYFWFFTVYGTLIPWWAKIFPENIKMFPFMEMVVNRPWYFYFQNITLSMPVYAFAWIAMIGGLKKRRLTLELVWALSFLIPITLYGVMGQGYQTRYILPAIPALTILSADLLNTKDELIWALAVFLLAIGFLTGILNTFIFRPADIFPLYYFIHP